MILDLQEVVKIVQRGPVYTWHHSSKGNSNSNIIVGWYQNQEINIDTIRRSYSEFSNFVCTYLSVYTKFYVILSCADSCKDYKNWDIEQFHHHKDSSDSI